MNNANGFSVIDDAPLEAALADYFARLDRGERVDVSELISRHPGCEAGLNLFLRHERNLHQAVTAASRSITPHDELAGRIVGDFRLKRVIGRGGMGVVYEAEQVSLGRRVALKMLPFAETLDKQHLARFKNEARAAATLDHDNIVAIHSVGSDGDLHYYAMQLVDGHSLAQLLDSMRAKSIANRSSVARAVDSTVIDHGPRITDFEATANIATLPEFNSREYFSSIARLGIQAAEALDHAHQNGILHRDIKPANLLVDGAGKLWVADFGLARIEHEAGMTMTGDVIGTLRYMSPEQTVGKRAVIDHRSDIYSLGVTLYELLTLRPAFVGDDRQEVLLQITSYGPPAPRQINARIPHDLETIVIKATQREPEDRYESAGDLAADLKRFLDDEPIVARRPSLGNRTRKWARRHVGLLAAAAVLMLLAAIGAGVSAMLIAQERTTAQQSAAQSNKNLSLALQALDEALSELFIGDLSDSRSRITKNQRELMRRGVQFYEELARQNGVDPTTWPTYLSLLRASSLENAYELGEAGRNDEAKKAYQEAVAQAEQLQANLEAGSQKQIDARGALAGCLSDYATFLQETGELKTAARHLLQARKIIEELRRQTSDETKYAPDLGANHYNMGIICTKAGRHGDAEYSYSHALPLLELTVRTNPEKLAWRRMLAMCQYNLGHLLYVYNNADRYEEARIHLEKSLVEWQRLASNDPFVSEYHCRVGATLNNLGVLAMERGDLAEARKHFEQALVNQKRAVAQQPIYKLTHEFMGHHYRELTAVLDQLGDAEALEAIEKEQMEWQASSSLNSNRAE